MALNMMGLHFEITKKLILKTVIFLVVAIILFFLAFVGGRSSLTTSEEVCTRNAVAAGVEPVGCQAP